MNILITGANGFIGMALCDKLLADGYQVRGAVRGEEKTEVRDQKSEVGSKRDERSTSNTCLGIAFAKPDPTSNIE